MACASFLGGIRRKKNLDGDILVTPLRRCLTTFDLVILGMSQIVGAGIYIIAGAVASTTAGPGVFISFLIAGVAALLSALLFMEFGSRIPRTGSAYVYCYAVLGEGLGFLAGWCYLSEQIIGTSAVASAIGNTIDDMFDKRISNATQEALGTITVSWLSPYPDFLALLVLVLIAIPIILGVKGNAMTNNILTTIQIGLLLFVIAVAYSRANVDNWINRDHGGFLPFGFGGLISGASTCLFALLGFDTISVTSEEVKDPKRAIPLSILIVMPIVTTLYTLASTALTLMQPYYEIDPLAPFPAAFASVGLLWGKYIVAVGSLFAFLTTVLASLYSLSRVLYAMAIDGLLFSCIGTVNQRFKTPVHSILLSTFLSSLLAVFIKMNVLIELFSIGTLCSYILVAVALLRLRYQPSDDSPLFQPVHQPGTMSYSETSTSADSTSLLQRSEDVGRLPPWARRLPLIGRLDGVVTVEYILAGMLTCQMAFGICVSTAYRASGLVSWPAMWVFLTVFGLAALAFFVLLVLHKRNDFNSGFRVPFSPFAEVASISINFLLMFMLPPITWARLGLWLVPGVLLYGTYGFWNSTERYRNLDSTNSRSNTEKPATGPKDSLINEQQDPSYGTVKSSGATG